MLTYDETSGCWHPQGEDLREACQELRSAVLLAARDHALSEGYSLGWQEVADHVGAISMTMGTPAMELKGSRDRALQLFVWTDPDKPDEPLLLGFEWAPVYHVVVDRELLWSLPVSPGLLRQLNAVEAQQHWRDAHMAAYARGIESAMERHAASTIGFRVGGEPGSGSQASPVPSPGSPNGEEAPAEVLRCERHDCLLVVPPPMIEASTGRALPPGEPFCFPCSEQEDNSKTPAAGYRVMVEAKQQQLPPCEVEDCAERACWRFATDKRGAPREVCTTHLQDNDVRRRRRKWAPIPGAINDETPEEGHDG